MLIHANSSLLSMCVAVVVREYVIKGVIIVVVVEMNGSVWQREAPPPGPGHWLTIVVFYTIADMAL